MQWCTLRRSSVWCCTINLFHKYAIWRLPSLKQSLTRMWANAQPMVALQNIGGALCSTPQKLGSRPLLDCRAVTLRIGERKTWGRKVNFAPGKMYTYSTSPGKGQTLCKVWLASVERRRCSNEAKTRKPLKLAGMPKLTKRSQPLVGRSSPYCADFWRRYCCLTSFIRLSICALVAKI